MSQEHLYEMVSSRHLDGLCAMVSEAISKGWEPQGSPFRAEREGYPAQAQHWYQAMVRRPAKGLVMGVEETAGAPEIAPLKPTLVSGKTQETGDLPRKQRGIVGSKGFIAENVFIGQDETEWKVTVSCNNSGFRQLELADRIIDGAGRLILTGHAIESLSEKPVESVNLPELAHRWAKASANDSDVVIHEAEGVKIRSDLATQESKSEQTFMDKFRLSINGRPLDSDEECVITLNGVEIDCRYFGHRCRLLENGSDYLVTVSVQKWHFDTSPGE